MSINLDCVIYADAQSDKLRQLLQQLLSESSSDSSFFECNNSVEILKNLDFDSVKRQEFPDGFPYFQHRIEIFPVETKEIPLANQISLVSMILNRLWSNRIPAVAACDYEDSLPNSGGYTSVESHHKKDKSGE